MHACESCARPPGQDLILFPAVVLRLAAPSFSTRENQSIDRWMDGDDGKPPLPYYTSDQQTIRQHLPTKTKEKKNNQKKCLNKQKKRKTIKSKAKQTKENKPKKRKEQNKQKKSKTKQTKKTKANKRQKQNKKEKKRNGSGMELDNNNEDRACIFWAGLWSLNHICSAFGSLLLPLLL